MAAFEAGKAEVLWNAKPRFGKTLTTYDLMRTLDVRRVLIVTNRPAIANSWFDDFTRFIGHQTTYRFVSESPSLAGRSPMTREQWRAFSLNHQDEDPRIVEFLSLQDLKGSQYFGGSYDKLKHIAEFDWDLLVIDEAHEGIDTTKTDVAFDQIKRKWTLHLSGTPFKALASGKFDQDQIFNWTYEDEQIARQQWEDDGQENPYAALPTLNLLTYQISRMITDRLAEGVAIDEDEANIDYTFDLNEFFATKDNGFFEHEAEVIKFLDCLATNEKYPFSTPELRDEIRHSFWLLNRVASAKALERLLKKHDVFKDYTVILAAGDGRSDDDTDPVAAGKSLDKVRTAIAEAEKSDGKTITLSVGQLTTGVTVPEWTAVIMLSNLSSPAQYMQAAFRAQNPCTFERAGHVFQKQNAYIFDFAPERTLTIFDAFANNLHPNPSGDQARAAGEHPHAAELLPGPGRGRRGPDDRARRLPGPDLPAGVQGPRGRAPRVPVEPAVRERRRHLPLLRARQGDPRQAAHREAGQGHDRASPSRSRSRRPSPTRTATSRSTWRPSSTPRSPSSASPSTASRTSRPPSPTPPRTRRRRRSRRR